MDKPDFVTADGYISDDSDFYGSVELRNKLESQSKNVNILQLTRDWAKSHVSRPIPSTAPSQPVEQVLYNCMEGNMSARQLGESADEFVKRLPPRTTSSLECGAWIWVMNPIVKGKGKKAASYPDTEGVPTGDLTRASDLIEQFEIEQSRIKSLNAHSVQSTITKRLNPLREKLKEEILDIAVACNETSGKWMLFPRPQDLHRVWKTVVEAVIEGRLGSGAKVATADPPNAIVVGGTRTDAAAAARLICIYTKNFSDLEDVRRVLLELVELGLAPREGDAGAIYYKCDVYTMLGLNSNNPYGMKASLYSSKDLLSKAGETKRKAKSEGRQTKLSFKKQKTDD